MSAPLLSMSSSEEEEITARPPSKVHKKYFKQCYMHLTSIKKEETKDFTRTRWDTFRNCVKRWLFLQGENQRIAKKLRSRTGLPVACAGPVLSALCIICKKTDKYNTVGGKHQKDHLSQAETSARR